QFSSLIAAEVYLVVGLLALITVYLLRSWMTPLWNLAWRPVAFALTGLRVGAVWLADSAGFALLRLVDGAATVWLVVIQPAVKRSFARTAEYGKRQGPVVLREVAVQSSSGREPSAALRKQGGAIVLE